MDDPSSSRPPGGVLGTSLTPAEVLRLLLLLCGPPWLFALALFGTGLVPPPKDALGWIVTILAGPAAWGAFISAVADGRTLLGRPKGPGTARRPWWREIRIEDRSVRIEVVGGDRIQGQEVADHGSAIAKDGRHELTMLHAMISAADSVP